MINGSGWTVVQRRVDGGVSFQRGWNDYRHGFGSAYADHWVGTDKLHWLTTQRSCRLRVDLWDWAGGRSFAEYEVFRVDDEEDSYRLHVRGYHGNAGALPHRTHKIWTTGQLCSSTSDREKIHTIDTKTQSICKLSSGHLRVWLTK